MCPKAKRTEIEVERILKKNYTVQRSLEFGACVSLRRCAVGFHVLMNDDRMPTTTRGGGGK